MLYQSGLLQHVAYRLSIAAQLRGSSSHSSSLVPALTALLHSTSGTCAVASDSSWSSEASKISTSSAHTNLTNSQLESVAIFRRFNIAQPNLQGQVILAKVLRTTSRQFLVDSGYYGLNWISRQELAAATGFDINGQLLLQSASGTDVEACSVEAVGCCC
jgi:hypothetical protein